MQIIIPMTGNGSRFKSAGYDVLKPFIKVHGVPMIEWVTRLFPDQIADITYVCRQDHLDTMDYITHELNRIAPDARIIGVSDWAKKGPVHDILSQCKEFDADEPTLVSYCDYFMLWDYKKFVNEAQARNCDGAIPCYSGFHPNLLPKDNLYASCKVDENDNLMEIREKFSWNDDKTKTRHSPGMYYFKSGALMEKYYSKMMTSGQPINGEYYSSMPYNFMVKDGLEIWCPINVSRFCQWGTPRDLQSYEYWTNTVINSTKVV